METDLIREFVLQLVPYLQPWELDEAYYAENRMVRLVNLHGLPGAAIYFHRDRQPGRVDVSGGYPHGFYPREEERGDITLRLGREALQAARDLQRRFITFYEAQFRAIQEQVYLLALAQMRAQDMADELAAVLGRVPQSGFEAARFWSRYGVFIVQVGNSEPYISLEQVRGLPPVLALQLARLFADWEQTGDNS